MRFLTAIVLATELASAFALPTQKASGVSELEATSLQGLTSAEIANLLRGLSAGQATEGQAAKGKAAKGKTGQSEAAKGEGAKGQAGEGEAAEGEGNEVNITGAFNTPVELQGGDIKQDTLFTKSAIGAFEYEFQAATGDTVTVTENKTPAAPPTGFVAIEPSSFKVALTQSKGVGLTLSKIDYIFDAASPALAGIDIKQAKVGKLCADVGAFVIEETLGEVEFEAEENEVSLNLNKDVKAEGEWGIFLPATAVAAAFTASMRGGNATAVAAPPSAKAKVEKEE